MMTGNDMPMSLFAYREVYRRNDLDIIHANYDAKIVYTPMTSIYIQDEKEFNIVIMQAKKKISERPYILDRFEPWEITGEFKKGMRLTLMSRARNNEERKIVESYIKGVTE